MGLKEKMKSLINKVVILFLTIMGLLIITVGFSHIFGFAGENISYTIHLIYFVLLLIDGLLYLICAWGVFKKIKLLFYFAFILVSVNVILIIFDQIGLIDIVVFLVNIITIILMVWEYRNIFKVKNKIN